MEQQDESDVAAPTPLLQAPINGRVPLGEVAGNNGAESEAAKNSEEQAAPAKKGIGKGKKGNTAKKANQHMMETGEQLCVEVLEDENQSAHSSAAEGACQELMKDDSQGMLLRALAFDCAVTNVCRILKVHRKSLLIMTGHTPHHPLPPTQLAENYHRNLQHRTSILKCRDLMM